MSNDTTFVALDVHKKEHTVAMLLPNSDQPVVWTVINQKKEIKRMIKKIKKHAPGPVRSCYEAGCCGFGLQRTLEASGISCQVIAPSLVPVKPGERIKTDYRDATKLVFMHKAGLLTEVHPPNEQEESVRDLCRQRQGAQEDLLRIRHQLSKFLLRRSYIYNLGSQWTQRHIAWLRQLKFSQPMDQEILTNYYFELEHRMNRVKQLDQLMEQVSQEAPYQEPVAHLRCFRGIDTVTALSLVAELHGFARFQDPRQLMSYLGLTPSESSSGDTQRKGGITKAGNKRVRRLLVEASWHQRHRPHIGKALRKRRTGQPPWVIAIADKANIRLHQRYWHLLQNGKPPCKANVAVSRELVGFLWAVLYRDVTSQTDTSAA